MDDGKPVCEDIYILSFANNDSYNCIIWSFLVVNASCHSLIHLALLPCPRKSCCACRNPPRYSSSVAKNMQRQKGEKNGGNSEEAIHCRLTPRNVQSSCLRQFHSSRSQPTPTRQSPELHLTLFCWPFQKTSSVHSQSLMFCPDLLTT